MVLDTFAVRDRELVQDVIAGVQPQIDRLLILSADDKERRGLVSAAQASGLFPGGIAMGSPEERRPLTGVESVHLPIKEDNRAVLDELDRRSFPGGTTLVYLGASLCNRAAIVARFGSDYRVVLQTPIATNAAEAERVVELAGDGCEVYAADDKLFTSGVRLARDLFREHPDMLQQVSRIEGEFYQMDGYIDGDEQVDGMARGLSHLLNVLVTLYRPIASPLRVVVPRAWQARYEPDPLGRYRPADVSTAGRMDMRLGSARRQVTADLRSALAASANSQTLRLYDGFGERMHRIPLDDSPVGACARMFADLLRPQPVMPLSLVEALGVVVLLDSVRDCARQELPYAFGEMQPFLL